jgi:hypothetical protein
MSASSIAQFAGYRIRFTGTSFFDPQGFWIGYRDVVVAKAKAGR